MYGAGGYCRVSMGLGRSLEERGGVGGDVYKLWGGRGSRALRGVAV